MKTFLRAFLPVVLVVAASLGAWWMVRSRSVPEPRPREVPPPLVRVAEVHLEDRRLTVSAQGTVSPRRSISLVAEVSGTIVAVSPSLVAGGFFDEGDVLLTLDDRDYRLGVVRARSDVARAELALAREEAEAEVARQEWADLGEGEATPLVSRELQVSEARAALAASHAALERAEIDLERTRVRAPFAGRVREKSVDLGQFVARGTPLASVYSVDAAEVRLPLAENQMGYLDLTLDYRQTGGRTAPGVVLRARFADEEHAWTGRIVRVEGEIDPRTRLVNVVARVDDPYGGRGDRPPLAVGLFVHAEIEGRLARNVVVLPREALRGTDRVYLVDDDERLRFREVDVLRAGGGEVVIRGGLQENERVCLSPLEAAVEGMRVRLAAPEGRTALPEEPA